MTEILRYPDPRLIAKNDVLGTWTPEAARRVQEMREILARTEGVGLAAPQVGWNVRLFILDLDDPATGERVERVVFDPTIDCGGEKEFMPEGCLSFPWIEARIERWTWARLKGQTPEGPIDQVLTGLAAQAVQHEMDHLDGILFTEKMREADRRKYAPVLRQMEENWRKSRS